jgi:hypothetical protein
VFQVGEGQGAFGAFFLRDLGIGDGLLAVAGSILPDSTLRRFWRVTQIEGLRSVLA